MLNKDDFLKKYHVERVFEQSDLEWSTLNEIFESYSQEKVKLDAKCKELISYVEDFMDFPIHSIRGRAKDAEHLIEKIIRKRGYERSSKYKGIDATNYNEIIRDTIGIRILVLSKEEWEKVHNWLLSKFPENDGISDIYMAEPPCAYIRYGDRDILGTKIHREYSNRGYRSQHYIVKYKGTFCEIQVRTLTEEVYGEFDHKVKYPYRDENKFLRRYTNIVSQHLDAVDEMISTCLQLGESGWNQSDQYYEHDTYEDWSKTSQPVMDKKTKQANIHIPVTPNNKIEMTDISRQMLLRKVGTQNE